MSPHDTLAKCQATTQSVKINKLATSTIPTLLRTTLVEKCPDSKLSQGWNSTTFHHGKIQKSKPFGFSNLYWKSNNCLQIQIQTPFHQNNYMYRINQGLCRAISHTSWCNSKLCSTSDAPSMFLISSLSCSAT